jgi:hypothetical protein
MVVRAPARDHRGMTMPDLDRWIDDPLVRTHHRRDAPVDERRLWSVAGTVTIRECRVLGRLIPARIAGISPDTSFAELFAGAPFAVLDEGSTFRLSGLCGRIWSVRGQFTALDGPEAFRTWREPGTVRVLFANWVEVADHGASLISEVRVAPVDRRARLRLRAFSPFIAAFQGLVAAEPLTIATQRAVRGGAPEARR